MNNEPENAADTPEAEMPMLDETSNKASEDLNTQAEEQSVTDVIQEQVSAVEESMPVIEVNSEAETIAAASGTVEDVISEAEAPATDVAEVLSAVENDLSVAEPISTEAPSAEMPGPEPVMAEVLAIVEPVAEVTADEPAAAVDETAEATAPAIEKTEAAEELDDNFIKEKVAAAKAAKKKAPARPRKPTKRERLKLPDLGDGSGYEPPEAAAVDFNSGDPSGGAVAAEAVEEAFWYAVHCYSGYENKVKHSLEQRIETMGMAGRILEIVVPTEEEIEVRDGKRKTVERRVFPGYVLVRMKMSEESWFVVRNTPGVTRFIGMGNRPQPLTQQEVNQVLRRMEAEAPKIRVSFKSGQRVRITDGPFADFPGLVDKIDTERAKVTVLVSFFGRETPVELDFLQVEKM